MRKEKKKENECIICDKKIHKEICSVECAYKYIDSKEFNCELDNLLNSLLKPRTK